MAASKRLSYTTCIPLQFLIFLLAFSFSAPACQAYELLIGTEKEGTFSNFAGKAVCRSIHKLDRELTCRTVPSVNYTDSLTNVLSGSLDFALVNSKTINDAFLRTGYFQYVTLDYAQLRLLMPLYQVPITLLVRNDAKISNLTELAGKRVNGGAPFSLQNLIFKEIMRAAGWQKNSFSLYQELPAANAQDVLALQAGSVQAMLHVGMHPDPKVEASLVNGRTTLVGVSGQPVYDLIDDNVGFSSRQVPAGTYPEQLSAIETLSLDVMLIASADAEHETVTRVLAAITLAKQQLQLTHRSFLRQQVDTETLNNSYLHPHPAAILFFQANQNRL